MADGLGDKLSGKTCHQDIVGGYHIGNHKFYICNGAFLFMGEVVEHGGCGCKRPLNFTLGQAGAPACLGDNFIIDDMSVACAGNDFPDHGAFLAEATAEYANDGHLILLFLKISGHQQRWSGPL
jgi:hypothetical protein